MANAGDTSGSIELTLSQTLSDGSVQTFVLQSADLALQGVGNGLTAAGVLESGATYSVLASGLAQAAGVAQFSGQLQIVAAFPQAQAVNFVFDSAFNAVHGFSADKLGPDLALLPTRNLPPLIWPVKFMCGYVPEFKFGIWLSDIDILNPGEEAVEVVWKAVDDNQVVLSSGSTQLGPHGVLGIPCFEAPYSLRGKGFLKLTAKQGNEQRLLQVVAQTKNLEFSEIETQKGYPIPPIQVGGRWIYGSEFVCGDAPSVEPSAFRDIHEIVDESDIAKVWRPGAIGTHIFLGNPNPNSVQFRFTLVDRQSNFVVGPGQPDVVHSRGVRVFDCSLVDHLLTEGGSFVGWLRVDADTRLLNMTFDKYDYSVVTDGSLHVEYVRPMRGRIVSDQ